MHVEKDSLILTESALLESEHLARTVTVDFYLPVNVPDPREMSLLLINDGQDMEKLGLQAILEELYESHAIRPVMCAAIHCGEERRMEYGTVIAVDFKGRGAK